MEIPNKNPRKEPSEGTPLVDAASPQDRFAQPESE
jgi:hypothetical protein